MASALEFGSGSVGASNTSTSTPPKRSSAANHSPTGPAPTTTTWRCLTPASFLTSQQKVVEVSGFVVKSAAEFGAEAFRIDEVVYRCDERRGDASDRGQ